MDDVSVSVHGYRGENSLEADKSDGGLRDKDSGAAASLASELCG